MGLNTNQLIGAGDKLLCYTASGIPPFVYNYTMWNVVTGEVIFSSKDTSKTVSQVVGVGSEFIVLEFVDGTKLEACLTKL